MHIFTLSSLAYSALFVNSFFSSLSLSLSLLFVVFFLLVLLSLILYLILDYRLLLLIYLKTTSFKIVLQ